MNLTSLIPFQEITYTNEAANDLDDLWQSCLYAAEAGPDDRDQIAG